MFWQKISKKADILLIISPFILSLITILFYFPSLHYAFQFDDGPNILKFYNLRNLDFKSLFFYNARWISTWINTLNYHIGKLEPFTYRCFNLAIHISTGIIVFYFFYFALAGLKNKNFFKDNAFGISLFTSLLFLLHPVQTQTVSYIVQGRLEGIATLFVMSICFCYLIFAKLNNGLIKAFLGIWLILLAIFSTGTKEIAIVSPFLVMLIDWFFIAQGSFESYKKRIPFYLLLMLVVFGFYIYFLKPKFFLDLLGLKLSANNNLGNIITEKANEQITPWYFFISQFKVIIHYLFIFIWPFNISVEYDWKLENCFWGSDVILPLLLLIIIGIIVIYLLKKDKINPVVFGILWFFISIAPRSTIIPSAELLVDYKTYLASIGWLFIISILIIRTYQYLFDFITNYINKLPVRPECRTKCGSVSKDNKKCVHGFDTFAAQILTTNGFSKKNISDVDNKQIITASLLIIFVFLLGFATYSRNLVWRSSLEFWKNVIDNAQKSRAYNNYAVELSRLQRFQESIPYFKKSLKLDPTYCEAYSNLASVYAILGKIDFAIEILKDSLAMNKYQPEAYNNLGTFLMCKQIYEEAEKCFISALSIVPHYGKAMLNYGRLLSAQGKKEEAWQKFKLACTKTDFDMNYEAFEFYGNTSLALKKFDDAVYAFSKILEFEKDVHKRKEALFNLGNTYFIAEQMENAIGIFSKMINQFPHDYRGWCNLIESLICIKNYDKALDIIKRSRLNKIYYPGIEIQQAKILAALGQVSLSIKVLQEFIKVSDNKNLKDIAKKMVWIMQSN